MTNTHTQNPESEDGMNQKYIIELTRSPGNDNLLGKER